MVLGLIAIVGILSLFGGIFGGLFISKIVNLKRNRKIEKNLIEVIEGKRENVLEINGKKFEAKRFKITNEDGKDIIIDLQGGMQEEDENKQNNKERKNIVEEDSSSIGKDSKSTRVSMSVRKNKERPTGNRRSRRRFG